MLLTGLLAAAFASAGETVLRRRSAGAFAWNEAFLVGAGCSAALLFPLSLLVGSRALDVLMALLGLALLRALVWRLLRRSEKPERPARRPYAAMDILLVALIVLAVAVFAALSFRYTLFWDGFEIYASKAKRLYYEGGLTRDWFAEDHYDRRLLEYPPLLSMAEAMLARLRGAFDFGHFKPLFPLFYVSLILSTFAAARARASRLVALWAALLVALLPELATTQAVGGSSDMPLAAFVAGTAAACFRRESRRALPFLIGSLAMVKNEGTILAVVASAAVLAYWSAGGLRRLVRRLRTHAGAVAVTAAFLVSRFAFLRWIDVHDGTYASIGPASIARAFERLELVARVCARFALQPEQWGLFWPAAILASVILWIRGARLERFFAGALWASVAAYTAIFLFTNWDVELQAAQAYSRLLGQLSPAALIVAALSYERLRRRFEARTGTSAFGRAPTFAEAMHVRR
jgi:hypothetical protein